MRIFDNFFLDLDNFFYIINKEKESPKMNETVEQTYPARKVLNSNGMRKRDSINFEDIIAIGSHFYNGYIDVGDG